MRTRNNDEESSNVTSLLSVRYALFKRRAHAVRVIDRHSFSVFDVDCTRLTMTQIDESGAEIDRIVVTKASKRQSSAGERGA